MKLQITADNKKYWALAGVGIASFLGCLDFTIVNTAIPAIQNTFHASVNQLQWIMNIFMLALSSSMVLMGKLADLYGRRLVLYIGMIVFAIASLLAGCAINMEWLIVWRLIQGFSCAVLFTASGAVVSDVFSLEERGWAMGVFFGIAFTGIAAGPAIGGLIVGLLSWRWVFLVNIPMVIISLVLCGISISTPKNTSIKLKIDYLGAIVLMLGIAVFIITITQGNFWGWTSNRTIIMFLLIPSLLGLLYYVEKRNANPIINFSLFTNRAFISGGLANVFLSFFYCLAFFLMPLYLHNIRHESAYQIGLMMLSTTFFVAITPPLIGKLVDRRGPYLPCLIGFALFILSGILQANFSANTSISTMLIAFILMGVAWGAISSPSTVLAMSSLPRSSEALAIGTCWTLHNMGGIVGLSIGSAIYHKEAAKHNNSFIAGYNAAMYLVIASSLFALLILYWNYKKRKGIHHI